MGQKAADQLRQILIPDLLSLIGDPHTHLVTPELVQRYLQHNQLIFDDNTKADMFAEADFKNEGGLSSGPLIAAIQGRSAPTTALWCHQDRLHVPVTIVRPPGFPSGVMARRIG